MTERKWVAKHCIECHNAPDHCRTCECHQPRKEDN